MKKSVFLLMACLCLMTPSVIHARKKPELTVKEVRIAEIDFTSASMEVVLDVKNILDVPLTLAGYSYTVHVSEKQIHNIKSKSTNLIDLNSSKDIVIPFSVTHADLIKKLKSLPDVNSLPFHLEGGIHITSRKGNFRLGFSKDGEIPVLRRLRIKMENFQVVNKDDKLATVAFDLRIENPNPFPSKLDQFTADAILNGITIGQGLTIENNEVPAQGTITSHQQFDVRFSTVGQSFAKVLESPSAKFQLTGETMMGTPWGNRKLNYHQGGQVNISNNLVSTR